MQSRSTGIIKRAVIRRKSITRTAAFLLVAFAASSSDAFEGDSPDGVHHGADGRLDCEVFRPQDVLAEIRGAVQRGEIADPAERPLPAIARRRVGNPTGEIPCLTPEHVFAFEDTDGVLLTDYAYWELFALMIDAANELMATHGDNYDFIGYFTNFEPKRRFATAFYQGIENDVLGIGLMIHNGRQAIGLGGEHIEGFVMMWNVNVGWVPGDEPQARFTRLVLAQEFEHRFAMFLPDLLDGRAMQGESGGCGRRNHWSWRVDGQGSCMEIAEWVGENPANLRGRGITFNTDIGGVFSYTDLYLMGYVSPAEMDAGNSELRFMDESASCQPVYAGPISHFTSQDIIASAGPRVPGSDDAQKHFRTGWIMIHQPDDEPNLAERQKTVGILQQQMIDWEFSTLGRGTMSNALFDDCNCNGTPDDEDISGGHSRDENGNGIPDECEACIRDPAWVCDGDVDGDGQVNPVDSGLVQASFCSGEGCGDDQLCQYDLDCDGQVNPVDAGIVQSLFATCESPRDVCP